MLLDDGATIDARFGARPLYEADMLVRVADAGINDARTPAEVLAHVDRIMPFIELPDLAVQEPGQLDGAGISAINVGTRLGVLGHPLNAVVWLAGALEEQGMRMAPGQFISLGSFSALLPPEPGLTVTVSYGGVTDLAPATVSFR